MDSMDTGQGLSKMLHSQPFFLKTGSFQGLKMLFLYKKADGYLLCLNMLYE